MLVKNQKHAQHAQLPPPSHTYKILNNINYTYISDEGHEIRTTQEGA